MRALGSGGDNPPLIAVVRLPPGTTVSTPGVRPQLAAAFGAAGGAPAPGTRSGSFPSTGDRAFVSRDGRTACDLLYPPADPASSDPYVRALPKIERSVAALRVSGSPVRITGASILEAGGQGGSRSVLAETMIAGGGRAHRPRDRVRLACGAPAAGHRRSGHTVRLHFHRRADLRHDHVVPRAEHRGTDRARRRDRLRAAHRDPVAGRARDRNGQSRGCAARVRHCRPGQCCSPGSPSPSVSPP